MTPRPETGILRATTAGLLLVAGHAHGQADQRDLCAQEVENFSDSMEQDVMPAMRAAECLHLIQRDRHADQLVIGMTSCEARTRL